MLMLMLNIDVFYCLDLSVIARDSQNGVSWIDCLKAKHGVAFLCSLFTIYLHMKMQSPFLGPQ